MKLDPQKKPQLLRLLRTDLNPTEFRDIADTFGESIGLGYAFSTHLEGDGIDARASFLVAEAQRKDCVAEFYAAILVWRPDLESKLPPLLSDAPTPQPSPQSAPPPVQQPTAQDEAKAKEYFERGNEAADEGDHDLAITLYTLAINLKPDYTFAYNKRGYSYHEKGDYDKAIADYTKAIALDPNFALAYGLRGDSYDKKGDHDKAIADNTRAIALDPGDVSAYYNRGIAYKAKGDKEAARRDLQKAADLGLGFTLDELEKF